MTNKATKYGLMTIAAVLLVAMAFAGAASASDIASVDDYIGTFSNKEPAAGTYYIQDGWKIPSLNNGTTEKLTINGKVTLDFTNVTNYKNFTDVTSSDSNVSSLFGYVSFDSSSSTLEIIGLNMMSVNVTSSGMYIGGIIGYAEGGGMLNFTNCKLVNCSINGTTSNSGRVGGLVGYAKSTSVNVEDCEAMYCDVMSVGSSVGVLVGYADSASFLRCNVTNSTVASSGGRNVGVLAGVAKSAIFDICNVANSSVSATWNVGGLVGWANFTSSSSFMNGSSVTNCIVSADNANVGGLVGYVERASGAGIENCMVDNCVVKGTNLVGGLLGSANSEPTDCSDNVMIYSAVKGGAQTNLDCGKYPGTVGCTDTTDSYINNGTAGQPQITVYPHTVASQPAPNYFSVINVTKLTNIGLQNDPKNAAGYVVVTEEPLVFNPCNGSSTTYAGNVQLGDTIITFATPVRAGYLFSGWNLTSISGTMLTDNSGNLQASVDGYTNATSQWNNASGVAVNLFANWTAAPAKEFVKSGEEITLDSGYTVSKINVSGTGINNISFAYDQSVVAPTRSGYHDQKAFGDAFNITVTNGSINGGKAKIYFNISKADLGICNPANIMLAHFKNNAWEYLATVKESEDSVNVQFSAETTSFSPFYPMYMVQDAQQYTPSSSSKQTGSTIILQEGQTAPTAYATATPTVAPTVKPTEQPATPTVIATAKPTTQATQQSPAPVFGIIAGLGAAAVLLRLRK